eukprot:TRINITY_DN1959_c1_g1_i1.p1 TRINITY_DN1959_c1_g1~~TRINITY_DN1959_c1_g1_i1.p1  ORF type:complete len:657 (+),score=109.88 TRINITY_DN1959_c1_g1_i1:43-2013(+)
MTADTSREAYQRFLAKNYDQCSSSLHSLLSSTPRGDPKIQHNVAVCEYFKGCCQDTEKFLSNLTKLGMSLEKEKRLDHPTSTAAVERLAAQRMLEYRPLCLEFEGHEYVRYNQAVVHFYQRQYARSIETLMPMYYNEGQITKLLHVRVMLLLLSCNLAQYKPGDHSLKARAQSLLLKIEQAEGFMNEHDAGSTTLNLGNHALLLKSHHAAIFGEPADAHTLLSEYLKKAAAGGNWWCVTTYLNNLGMLSLSIGKPHLASLYLSRATDTYEKNRPKPEGNQPMNGLNHYPSMATIYYNSGLCHMIRGQYELAFKAFVVATPLLKDTPTLWLRLAQCCIRHWEKKLASEQVKIVNEKLSAGEKKPTPVSERGVVYLPTHDILNPPSLKIEGGDEMTLVFADKCVRNAHYLLLRRCRGRRGHKGDDDKDDGKEEEKEEEAPQDEGEGQLEESELHRVAQNDPELSALLQAVYCNMAYLALCLSNYSVALIAATKLLSLPNPDKENKVVCLAYSTEAYCRLGRADEALGLLHDVDLQELFVSTQSCLTQPCGGIHKSSGGSSQIDLPSVESSPVHIGISEADREKLSSSHASALFTNLCVVHIMGGKFNRAQQCLDQFRNDGQPIADLLQLYLRLAVGDTRAAIAELKQRPPMPPFTVAA